jgi:hypothetical protein
MKRKAKAPAAVARQSGQNTGGQSGQNTGAKTDADFQARRFKWAADVLAKLGLTARITAAKTRRELDAIVFDDKSADVEIEIIAVLHAETRPPHFVGLSAKALKHILRNRFDDLRKYWKPPQSAAPDPHSPPVLNLVLRLIEMHVIITPEERMAVALWVLHCYVYRRFDITPRLALLSPVRGCGKTTVLRLLECLIEGVHRTDSITPAAVYHYFDEAAGTGEPSTLLVDEGDNLGLLNNGLLRSVFNSGHGRGGKRSIYWRGAMRSFETFGPLGVAAIGALPLPLLHRSVIVNMQRTAVEPECRLDDQDRTWIVARDLIYKWSMTCELNRDPDMAGLNNRAADNWRVLFAIADDLGHGDDARKAAAALTRNRPDEDVAVILLNDIRTIFRVRAIDRIPSAVLVDELRSLDDGMWRDWHGRKDDRPAHKLTQSELAALLKPFGIKSQTVWPVPRRSDSKSAMGYYRSQFEAAWKSYCLSDDDANTSTQSSNVRRLRPI